MHHWCKVGTVVGWNLVDFPRGLGFRVNVGISAADEPEHGRGAPFGSERPEILARRRRIDLAHTVTREMPAESIGNARACIGIVDSQRVVLQRGNLGWPGSSRSCCLCIG